MFNLIRDENFFTFCKKKELSDIEIISDRTLMARHEGLEPPTDRFEVCDSIH